MSLTIKGATSGSVDVVAPASGSDVTLTLPTTTATVETTASSIASSRLTGALPALNGSALTGVADATKLPLAGGTLTNTLTVQNNVSSNTDPSLVLSGTSNLSQDCYLQMAECWTGLPLAMGMDNSTNTFKIARNSSGNLNSGAQFVITSTGEVGIGESTPLAKVHIKTGDAGSITPASGSDEMVLESGGSTGLSIFHGTTSAGRISFGSTASGSKGEIYHQDSEGFKFSNSGTAHLNIGHAGWVQMPNQPVFMVHQLTMPNNTQGAATGGTALVNVGGHYNTSNGRFTAPIGGTYIFTGHAQEFGAATVNYLHLAFRKNGASYGADAYHGIGGTYNTHKTINNTAIFNLSVNDYIQLYAGNGARNGTQNAFAGYLIG